MFKGPEVGVCLAGVSTTEEASVAGSEWGEERSTRRGHGGNGPHRLGPHLRAWALGTGQIMFHLQMFTEHLLRAG